MSDYINIDYDTFKQKAIEILQESDTFKDYNFEGSNISVILELLSFLVENNTYYQNKIAENLFMDTANIYNTVHRLSSLKGYKPVGHISAYTKLQVTVNEGFSPEDQLYVPMYSKFMTEDEEVEFITTKDYFFDIPAGHSGPFTFEVGVKQGRIEKLNYTSNDIVDFKILLPTRNYDHDDNTQNEEHSVKVFINNEQWTRSPNFFELFSGYEIDENIYMFNYNKYRNYVVEFSPLFNNPTDTDDIEIHVINTLGEDGSVGSNYIKEFKDSFITNIDTDTKIHKDYISINNEDGTKRASYPETLSEIKSQANATINSQLRNVNSRDFNSHLRNKRDIVQANVWGEKEINPYGDTQLYNKGYVVIIPDEWTSDTIITHNTQWYIEEEDKNVNIGIPQYYNNDYKDSIIEYMEPRSMLNIQYIFQVPDLIYFYMILGLRVRRLYNYNNVKNMIKDKILYYFDSSRRSFNEIIDFRDIMNFLLDETVANGQFELTRGIKSLTFRDIIINKDVYEYDSDEFPRYTMESYGASIDNILRPIKIGLDQFPIITEESINIINES